MLRSDEHPRAVPWYYVSCDRTIHGEATGSVDLIDTNKCTGSILFIRSVGSNRELLDA